MTCVVSRKWCGPIPEGEKISLQNVFSHLLIRMKHNKLIYGLTYFIGSILLLLKNMFLQV